VCLCLKILNWNFASVKSFAASGYLRLSDTLMKSPELAELAGRMNISVDEFQQVMNISLNMSKVLETSVYHCLLSLCLNKPRG